MRYVHHEMPEVDFYCFGSETVLDIPDWITDLGYLSDEKLSDAYNRSSIFLVASSEEGFGLTALEAMSCGSVVVSTKNGGVQSFLEDGVNSKLAEIGDSAGLAESCIVILRDRNLLRELSVNAVSASANYSLDVSNSKFEEFLLNLK